MCSSGSPTSLISFSASAAAHRTVCERRTMSMNNRLFPSLALVAGLSLASGAALQAQESSAKDLLPGQFARLHRLIRPQAGEARWQEVPWMPSSDIWAARRKAAEEGKPLLLWYMAGEPLGSC